jgi:hypothetical protein
MFGRAHEHHTVENYCQYIIFTDEFTIDPSECQKHRIPRRPGTRYEPQNMQVQPLKKGSILFCAGWVTYHSKASDLIFYHVDQPAQDLSIHILTGLAKASLRVLVIITNRFLTGKLANHLIRTIQRSLL